MGLPQYQNVMDHLWLGTVWHLQNWRAQYTGVIKRVSLAAHAAQLKQENLVAPRMSARPDNKQKKPYEPSQSILRMCSACGMPGHFVENCPKPNIVQLSQAKRQKTIEAANALVMTLLSKVTNDREYFPPLIKENSEDNPRNEKPNSLKFRSPPEY